MLTDILRATFFATFGIGFAFMVATNVLAFRVLRPPKRLGFLWWHVTAISISFTCLGVVSLADVLDRIGQPATWQTYIVGFGLALFGVAQAIIFNVERSRYVIIKSGFLKGDVLDAGLLDETPT